MDDKEFKALLKEMLDEQRLDEKGVFHDTSLEPAKDALGSAMSLKAALLKLKERADKAQRYGEPEGDRAVFLQKALDAIYEIIRTLKAYE